MRIKNSLQHLNLNRIYWERKVLFGGTQREFIISWTKALQKTAMSNLVIRMTLWKQKLSPPFFCTRKSTYNLFFFCITKFIPTSYCKCNAANNHKLGWGGNQDRKRLFYMEFIFRLSLVFTPCHIFHSISNFNKLEILRKFLESRLQSFFMSSKKSNFATYMKKNARNLTI